jgi:hypothetical protein
MTRPEGAAESIDERRETEFAMRLDLPALARVPLKTEAILDGVASAARPDREGYDAAPRLSGVLVS